MKMKPKVFTAEQVKAIREESSTQTPDYSVPKSTDPDNFPVFEVPVNAKVLIYVPNHTTINAEGTEELRMDKPLFHAVTEGKKFLRIRCVRGLTEASGYSGNCPLCDGESEPWDLANELIKEQCKMRGLDVNDSENEAVKQVKRDNYSKRVIKAPEMYYTFPIVVLETEPSDIKKIVYDENGVPKHKAMWYTISKSAYEKKWLKTLEGMEDEPTHPGGEFFILNYTYDSKTGEYNKRDSARELQVVAKKLKGVEEFARLCDKETEEWDELKAMSTVIDNQYYEEADLAEEANMVLAGTREKLAIFSSVASGEAAALPNNGGFNLQKPEEDDNVGGELPMAGATDEDE